MRYKKLKLCAVLMLAFGLTGIQAQEAIPATGGDASGSGGTLAYSVGQIIYTTFTGTSGSVAQGVQQPYEILITTGLEKTAITLNYSAYPNPTTNYLMLQIDNYDKALLYQLYDLNGNILESKQVTGKITNIAMEQLAIATYVLRITQNNQVIKTFKIIKK